jgi:hypothetical protein
MGSVGIIAAAGKATRFNGILKELLPVDDGISLLERNIGVLYGVSDQIVIVTTPEKIAAHALVAKRYSKISLTIQETNWDIYGAMIKAMWIPHDRIHFVMADTYVPYDAFYRTETCPVWMGMHWTDTPIRFGVLRHGCIVNKPLLDEDFELPERAWGVLSWEADVSAEWFKSGVTDYTDAINIAIKLFPTKYYDLQYYYDVASFEDYWRLIDETRLSRGGNSGDREVHPRNWADAATKRARTRRGPEHSVVCEKGRPTGIIRK